MKYLPPNLLIDRVAKAADLADIRVPRLQTGVMNFSEDEYLSWAASFMPGLIVQPSELKHKKMMEYFISLRLLDPNDSEVMMDVGGGSDGYIRLVPSRIKILQDIQISQTTREKLGDGVQFVEGDARHIPMEEKSVDKISCHHAFEHFQGESDIDFIREIQRILKPGGRACIVPLFVATRYVEVTDIFSFKMKFDSLSHFLIDPTASLPGAKTSGHYARIYSVDSLGKRVVANIDRDRFSASLIEIRLANQQIPDMSLPCHRIATAVNFPYRALVIERHR